MFSEIALKVYVAKKIGLIKSNADFWKNFSNKEVFETLSLNTSREQELLEAANFDLICAFDDNFPKTFGNIKLSEKPFLFAYRGDIELLSDISKNVAVIGVREPTKEIIEREEKIVQFLVDNGQVLVSGLAIGCDTVAHCVAVNKQRPTIAFLPSTLQNIYPGQNVRLAEKIVASGGLVVSEYFCEPKDRFEAVKRFIERDRLQAMFSKAVILIASYRYGEGDSGSRHAMQKAKEYQSRLRFVMFNGETDKNQPTFGLNEDLLKEKDVMKTTKKTLKEILK